jgi:hypothetical protein
LKEPGSVLRGGYLPDPVGEVPLVIEQLEARIGIIGSPRFLVGEERQAVAVVADNQIVRETTVDVPSGASETLLYLFSVHFPLLVSLVAFHAAL